MAVLDSGFAAHEELSLVTSVDFVGAGAADEYGHGTHIAGIIAGDGSASDGAYEGVAKGAGLVSVRVLDDEGKGLTSDVIAGLDWVLANQDTFHIGVVNLSLGGPITESALTDPLVHAVETVWEAGIVVVCSAGNNGQNGYGTITTPGNSPRVITVGSLTDWNDLDPLTHKVSSYSSRGPTIGDHFVKPDLLAPGNRIVSVRPFNTKLDFDFPGRRKQAPGQSGSGHFELSGTSMATAVVSGAAALMLSADMSQTPVTSGGISDDLNVLVNEGSRVTYLVNDNNPGIGTSWTFSGFSDAHWAVGRYGIGYEESNGAHGLLRTLVPHDTRSVYTRSRFDVDDPMAVTNLFFGADYDDGVVAWINGQEVFRSPNVTEASPSWNASLSDGHESSNAAAPSYGTMQDISNAAPALSGRR